MSSTRRDRNKEDTGYHWIACNCQNRDLLLKRPGDARLGQWGLWNSGLWGRGLVLGRALCSAFSKGPLRPLSRPSLHYHCAWQEAGTQTPSPAFISPSRGSTQSFDTIKEGALSRPPNPVLVPLAEYIEGQPRQQYRSATSLPGISWLLATFLWGTPP